MSFIESHSQSHSHSYSLSIFLLIAILCTPTYADLSPNINVKNNCPYTVWAAAFPDGGQRLDHGQTWTINGTRARGGQIWARTNCSFDENGLGSCETGDCGGHLHCQTHGQPPHTFVDYVLTTPTYGLDLFNISLVKGFNVPIQLIIPDPEFPSCAQGIGCIVDITGQCPSELRVSGGCNDPCTVFKTDNYCCSGSCGPTKFSRFFKQSCPDAVSYPGDDKVNTYTCQGATYYDIVFCP